MVYFNNTGSFPFQFFSLHTRISHIEPINEANYITLAFEECRENYLPYQELLLFFTERETVCNTREVLTILYDGHRGNMDDWFESHTADELLEEVRDRGGPTLLSRLSRDINPDVIEVCIMRTKCAV